MKLLLKYGWILFLVTGLCGSCRNKDGLSEGSGTGKPLEIVAEIKGAEVSKSRTERDDFGSYSSKAGFSAGDKIGFYSMRDENGNAAGYENVPMPYDAQEKCFKKEDLIVEYPNNFGYTFAYYPYPDQVQTEQNVIDIYKDDNTIEDLLIAGTSKISGGRIYLSFVHAFSMLIIVPGNGFEESATDPANEVSVTLKKGWKASVVKGDEKIELQLESDENAPTQFVAQRRENVSYAEGQTVPVCYSVILPNGAEIDHIEMTDNYGTIQRIVPQLKALERSWRYPIKVSMEGTTPTVWPYKIQPWTTDDSPIELGGTYGITLDNFQTWVTLYNRYTSGSLSDEEKTQVNEALSAFGEKTNGKWRFQLNADINCKGLFGDNQLTSVVARLKDEFDGKNHTLSNLNTTLIGSIEGNGKITDLNIDVVSITSETTKPTGALALEMTGGEISNCDIKNIQIETNGPVGALVGKATAGTISGNTVNGLLLGTTSSDDGLTGTRDASVECDNNQSSALIF